jgi:biopolymer transport protein ExbB
MLPDAFQNGLELLHRGGWVMLPLLALSVASVTLMLERVLTIREAARHCGPLFEAIRPLVLARKFDEAARLCGQVPGPVAQILGAGVRNHALPLGDIERAMEEVALRETPSLQQNLGTLDTIITMAPLLGLLGTITGMINSFNVVSTAGAGASTAITGGVAEALIATATGLSVAIGTLPVYNWLTEKVRDIISDMEWRATQLLNLLAILKHEENGERPVRAVLWNDQAVIQAGNNLPAVHGQQF